MMMIVMMMMIAMMMMITITIMETKNGDDCHISVVSNNDDDGMVSS